MLSLVDGLDLVVGLVHAVASVVDLAAVQAAAVAVAAAGQAAKSRR